MSTTDRELATMAEEVPLMGGLLRLAHQELVNQVSAGLDEAGFGDVSQAQYPVMQQLGGAPSGKRLTELAAYAGLTKATMSFLVDGLEDLGYVERVPDPDDKRAQRVRFTARGRRFGKTAFRLVREVEAGWASRIGKKELETLRRLLRTIVLSRLTSGARTGGAAKE